MLLGTRLATLVSAGALVAGTLVLGSPSASSLPLPGAGDLFRPQLVTVDTPTREDKELLQTLGLDLTEHAGHDYVEVVLHSTADLAALAGAGLTHEVRIPDLVRRSAEINAADQQYAAATASSALPSGRTGYRTLDDYEADLTALATDHPAVVKAVELPHRSVEGRTIRGVEIGSDVHRAESGRPVFLLMGLHHAREWPSGELAMEFAVDLAEGYGSDPRITSLLDRARVVVVPVINPDGFDLSRTDGGVIDLRELDRGDLATIAGTPGHAYRRKNCRIVDGEDTPAGACRVLPPTSNLGAGSGVDLNRNYGGFWGGPGAAGPEPDPLNLGLGALDPTYRGPAPFSEPEIQNVRDLVSSRQVTMMISNHTFSNLILRPNGVHPDTIGHDGHPVGDAPDEEALKDLGAKMAAANGYANIHGWELYDTTGTTEDWSYNATGGFGYTFEIGEHEFHPPYAEVVDEYVGAGEHAGEGNREAYLVALEHAVDPQTHALVTGRAPAGAELRLTKTFQTPTWESEFEDSIDSSITVGDDGTFRWHVNPSTRPVVQERTVRELAETPYHSETFSGTALPLESVDHDFTVDAPADALEITLDPTLPGDDYDLELYRRSNGTLTEVGSSGNIPGEAERISLVDVPAGDYVLRVVNYLALSTQYTAELGLFDATTRTTEGQVESYELTCSVRGEVKETRDLTIDRGQTKSLVLSGCGPVGVAPTPPAQRDRLAKVTRPRVTGTPEVGRTLTTTNGTWAPRPTSVRYRWLRDGKRIKGAKGAQKRYVVRDNDRGKRLAVRVTANRAGFSATRWRSATVRRAAR